MEVSPDNEMVLKDLRILCFKMMKVCLDRHGTYLNLFHIQTLYDIPEANNFEKIVTKGEIAHNEQFLLFPQYFQIRSIFML